jgi:hypothetical protein
VGKQFNTKNGAIFLYVLSFDDRMYAIATVFVSRVGQQFNTKDDAYLFTKIMQNLLGSVCEPREQARKPIIGSATEKSGMIPQKEEPAKTEKGSKRCGCLAYVKVKKDVKQNFWYYDHVQEVHNHKLEPSARMTRYMHTHKHMEEGIRDIFNIMTKKGFHTRWR